MKVNTFSNCLTYIDSNAKDRASLLEAVAKEAAFLQHADENLRKNADFMMAAIRKNPFVMEYAHLDLKKDQGFMLKAIEIDSRVAMGHIDPSLKRNIDFILEAVKILKANDYYWLCRNAFIDDLKTILEHTDPSLKREQGFMLKAMEIDSRVAIEHADPSLKSDQAFMLKAMKIDSRVAMGHADPSLKKEQGFMLKAMEIDSRVAMGHMDPSLKSDQAFMLKIIKANPYAVTYASFSLKRNIDFILEAVKILKTNDYYWLCRNVFIDDLKTIIEHTDPSLKSDQIFMLKAMEINPRVAIEHADPSLKSNPDFMLKAMKIDSRVAMGHMDSSLKRDQSFMLETIKANRRAMKYADSSLKSNPDFVLEAMKIDFRIVKYISEDLKSDDNFMYEIVLQKPQVRTSSVDSIINSIINLDKLHLAPPLMEISSSMESDIMELSKEFNELTKEEISKYEDISTSDNATESEREVAQKKLKDLNLERKKLAELCRTIQSGPAEHATNFTKLFYKQLSLLLKNIMGQWKSSKGLEYKDKNLRALADVATRCEPTWLEEAIRIYSELDGTGTPQAKLLTLVQKYKEATILQLEQEDEDNEWHALNRIRKAHGKNLGLNTDLAELDMYINTGRVPILTEWNIKTLWDAPSLLESVHTALSTQEYDGSLYDFLLEITKKKNYVDKRSYDEEEYELKIKDYIAENFYDEDYKFKPHGVHVMLVDIGVLEAVNR